MTNPAGNYMFKVNNRNTRTRCDICSKLTIKIPERRHWRPSGIFIVKFKHFTPCSIDSIVNFEQVIAGWYYADVIFDKAFNYTFHRKLESLQYNAALAITGAIL